MLGKLMKYEFKATGRIFLPVFAALIIISAVSRLFLLLDLSVPGAIGVILSVILIIGVFVVTLILIIQRFRHNLLSSEGYLMMTLPLKTSSLILSKLFVSAIWSIASFIVVVLSIMIMAMTRDALSGFIEFLRGYAWTLLDRPVEIMTYTMEAVVFVAVTVLSQSLMIYACMSLSMLVNKHRGLFSFGMYIAMATVLQVAFSIVVSVAVVLGVPDALGKLFNNFSYFGISQFIILAIIFVQVLLGAGYYAITHFMLKNKLNLQ